MPAWGDSFTDTDGVGLLSHTPDSPAPFAWLMPGGVSVDSAEPIISDNALVPNIALQPQSDVLAPIVDDTAAPVIRVEIETEWFGTFLVGDDSTLALYLMSTNDFTAGYLAVFNWTTGAPTGDVSLYKGDFTDPFGYIFLTNVAFPRPSAGIHSFWLEVNTVTGDWELSETDTGAIVTWNDNTYPVLVASGFTIAQFGPTAMFRALSVGAPTGVAADPFTDFPDPGIPAGEVTLADPAGVVVAVLAEPALGAFDCNNDPA